MSDGEQFEGLDEVIAYLETCRQNRTAVGLGYDLRNMLLRMAEEIRAMKKRANERAEP